MLRGQYANGDCAVEVEHYRCFCRDRHTFRHNKRLCRNKTNILSRQKYACRNKTFVATKFNMFVTTKYFYDKPCSDSIYTVCVTEQFLGLGKVSLL